MIDAGHLDAARPGIEALLATDPGDARTWLLHAHLLAASGQVTEAQHACRQAIALWPDIGPACRLLSTLAEQTGDQSGGVEAARRLLLAAQPDDAVTANRIGAGLCAAGRFAEALPFLRQAAPVLGHAAGALWNYSTSLALTGSHHELLAIEPMLRSLAREVPPPFAPFVHLAGARLALRFDRELVLRQRTAIRQSANGIGAAQLQDRLERAIAQHEPFSVFEMPQGPARLALYADPKTHVTLSGEELSAIIDSFWTAAFGSLFESHGALAAGLVTRNMLSAIADADVIALPDAGQMAQAHEHFGFDAELQQSALRRPAPLIADLGVIRELHQNIPFLRPLLAEQPFLGFVGSYPDLVEKLARFCHIEQNTTWLVPGALNRAELPEPYRGADHYPVRLEQTLAGLGVPFPGAVFLVAAGLLGPIYCGRIKQLGGIAIDIDGVVDQWMRS